MLTHERSGAPRVHPPRTAGARTGTGGGRAWPRGEDRRGRGRRGEGVKRKGRRRKEGKERMEEGKEGRRGRRGRGIGGKEGMRRTNRKG